MGRNTPWSLRLEALLCAAGLLLSAGASSAADRARVPAEIELRRTEIAARLVVLVEEAEVLNRQLAQVRAAVDAGSAAHALALENELMRLETRLENVVTERDALLAEAEDLARIVTRTATGPVARADPPGLESLQVPLGSGQVSAGTAFNPAITVIPDGLYYYDNAGGGASAALQHIPAFGAAGAEIEAEDIPRGFSLREVELAFSGAVDPYFDVWATFGIGDGAIEAEEVYVQTRRFLPGVQLRFGRFFSGIGYLNRQHRHQWDFVDQALLYDALFGQHIAEVGVQATWLPDIPVYTQLGFEALQGDNGLIANQLADEHPDLLDHRPGPRLFTGFLKVSPDLGFSHTLQGGFSFGRSRSHQEAEAGGPLPDVFDGSAWFVGTDWIWRYDSARPYGQGDLTLQGEYFYRSKALELVSIAGPQESASQQDGLYAQVVYGIGPRWTIGGRFDTIGLRNRVDDPADITDLDAATRYSADVTFNPTEFSRLRVQYNYGRVPDGEPERLHQVFVQFQMSLGVHGAHVF